MPVIESAITEKEARNKLEEVRSGGVKEKVINGEVANSEATGSGKETLTNGDTGAKIETEVTPGGNEEIVNNGGCGVVPRRSSLEDELEILKFSLSMFEDENFPTHTKMEPPLDIPVEESKEGVVKKGTTISDEISERLGRETEETQVEGGRSLEEEGMKEGSSTVNSDDQRVDSSDVISERKQCGEEGVVDVESELVAMFEEPKKRSRPEDSTLEQGLSKKKRMVALSADENGAKRSSNEREGPKEGIPAKKLKGIEENGDEGPALDVPTSSIAPKVFEKLKTTEYSKMTKQGLLELIRHCFNDFLVNRSELGGLRQSVIEVMEDRDRINKQCNMLKKQVSDAKQIIKRLIKEKEAAKGTGTVVVPVKVTRSVGLQVCTAGSFYMRPESEFRKKSMEGEKENKAVGEAGGSVANSTQSPASTLIRMTTNAQKGVGGNGGKVQHFLIAKPVVSNVGVQPSTPPVNTRITTLPNMTTNKSGKMEVIDLTDKEDKPDKVNSTQLIPIQPKLPPISPKFKLPPLPPAPKYGVHPVPPRPNLRIAKSNAGILLSWNFGSLKVPTKVALFQLYAYQESSGDSASTPTSSKLWNKVGEVNALPLPMACTLTQFMEGRKYHFAVRAIDIYDRVGEFSAPGAIMLTSSNQDQPTS